MALSRLAASIEPGTEDPVLLFDGPDRYIIFLCLDLFFIHFTILVAFHLFLDYSVFHSFFQFYTELDSVKPNLFNDWKLKFLLSFGFNAQTVRRATQRWSNAGHLQGEGTARRTASIERQTHGIHVSRPFHFSSSFNQLNRSYAALVPLAEPRGSLASLIEGFTARWTYWTLNTWQSIRNDKPPFIHC